MFSGNPAQTMRLGKAVHLRVTRSSFDATLTSHKNCPTSRWSLTRGRRWGIRIRRKQHATFTVYNLFGTLRRHRRRWQARGHYLRRVRHDLLGAQYLSAYHTAVVRHHAHAHRIVTVRVTHVRAQGHLAHHGSHWSHRAHTHHGITHSHPPDTSCGFHLCAYARRVARVRRRQNLVAVGIVHVIAVALRGVAVISLLDPSIVPSITLVPLLPPVPIPVASVAALSPRPFARQCTSYY